MRTRFTELIGIEHPVVCAGMGAGFTGGDLGGRVSEAGGLGVIGASFLPPEEVGAMVLRAREITSRPIGINLLLHATEARVDEVVAFEPAVFSTAWARDDQDLETIFARAHDRGASVMHMAPTVADATRAAEAGADVIVAQGTEGGGHVGLIASTVIVPQVAKAVAPVPVLAAGGFANGAGLAAALALGADGLLLGTRFLATDEAPVPTFYKEAILGSDGDDTVLTTLADSLSGRDWPGAWNRLLRTRFVDEWLGREPELRRRRGEIWERLERAEEENDPDHALLWSGQSAGLIDAVVPAADVVREIVRDAEEIIRTRLQAVLVEEGGQSPPSS
ncbi:MAG TPA: nitronate monooxygenase family protein [Gaiellaceae bacterium]|nr:nitronate monooxygenase family protein [Gaiellaceae bacterium]